MSYPYPVQALVFMVLSFSAYGYAVGWVLSGGAARSTNWVAGMLGAAVITLLIVIRRGTFRRLPPRSLTILGLLGTAAGVLAAVLPHHDSRITGVAAVGALASMLLFLAGLLALHPERR